MRKSKEVHDTFLEFKSVLFQRPRFVRVEEAQRQHAIQILRYKLRALIDSATLDEINEPIGLLQLPILWVALENQLLEVTRLVLEKHPNAALYVRSDGMNLFHFIAYNNISLQKELYGLLPSGIDSLLNTTSLGACPIHSAVTQRNTSSLETLLVLRANIEAVNQEGNTALHVACDFGRLQAVEQLLEHKANVNAEDRLRRTPLYIAAIGWDTYHDITLALIKAGANLREPVVFGSEITEPIGLTILRIKADSDEVMKAIAASDPSILSHSYPSSILRHMVEKKKTHNLQLALSLGADPRISHYLDTKPSDICSNKADREKLLEAEQELNRKAVIKFTELKEWIKTEEAQKNLASTRLPLVLSQFEINAFDQYYIENAYPDDYKALIDQLDKAVLKREASQEHAYQPRILH